MKAKLLKWLLLLSGIFQIAYWGLSHLFFPGWYLGSIGLTTLARDPGVTVVFLNEIGVLSIGMGLAAILAARDPLRNFAIILVLYFVGGGSMAVSLYHILAGNMAAGEWVTIIVIAVQMLLITLLLPWSEIRKQGL